MRTIDKGNISEAIVLAKFVQHGYVVLIPWGGIERYDFAVDINGLIKKVQVKTARLREGVVRFPGYSVDLKSQKRRKYTKEEIDLFAAYCPDNEKVYLLDVNESTWENYLRVEPSKNGQVKGVRWATEYEL